MTGPLNWYKDNTQRSIDESMSLLDYCLCNPSHTDNPLRDLHWYPTDRASAPYLRKIRPDVPGI